MNCLFSGAITRIGGAQKRAGGVASVKYSPDEEFKDVDKIGLYIDVFFKGHLSKMMGLKNAFSSLYEKFMSKYTVTKPQYDEDFDSEALFDQIFGSKMDDE